VEHASNIGAVSLPEAGKRIGVSHSKTKELCRSGELRSFRVGRRRLCSYEAIAEYIAKQEGRSATGGGEK
jgi:excisionase family DNA binding protein